MGPLEKLVNYMPVLRHKNPEKVIPDYEGRNGIRAELGKKAHQYFSTGNYNPSFPPRNNQERVDQCIYYIYGALSGTLERKVKHGNKTQVQAYHTWQNRGERIQHYMGSLEEGRGLIYHLQQGLEDGTISPIRAQVVGFLLADMMEIALNKNAYLKKTYGGHLEEAGFFKDTFASLKEVHNIVEDYRYCWKFNEGFSLDRALEWGPVVKLCEAGQQAGAAIKNNFHRAMGTIRAAGSSFANGVLSLKSWGERKVEQIRYGNYEPVNLEEIPTEEVTQKQPGQPGTRRRKLVLQNAPLFRYTADAPLKGLPEEPGKIRSA
jgi:hypothetical protein